MTVRLALVMGDPAGIGPELTARLLAEPDLLRQAAILVIADRRMLEEGARRGGVALDLPVVRQAAEARPEPGRPVLLDMANADPATIRPAVASAEGGRATLENFTLGLDLARDGAVEAIVFTPFNKQALRLGGSTHEDELRYAAGYLGYQGAHAEFNVVDEIWNARVTSHVPISAVAGLITEEAILRNLELTVAALQEAGFERPRIAVAALNPHAGDGGNFGREEIEVIAPAVEKAKARGWAVDGPWPSDTVYLRARAGKADAVLTMYHDQGQIAIKLIGFDRGVTVLGGLPVPICTPAHGTAYDIVGQGTANLEPTR
ncbi:MAG: 4-hydroxythreonine-4-phosphate dehydrogenase PdxA, partial [Tistlia sp.]